LRGGGEALYKGIFVVLQAEVGGETGHGQDSKSCCEIT